jgi:hypothetical protein
MSEPGRLARALIARRPAGRSKRRVLIRSALALAVLAAAWTSSGCSEWAGGVEYAPAVPPTPAGVPGAAAKTAPETGPWFVDRARDFGLDAVTICGAPDKPSILHSLGSGAAVFDFDGDGDLDVFVAAGSRVEDEKVVSAGGPWLFRNDGPGRWRDVAGSSGLRWTGWAQGVAVADYDADGDLDLYVAQHGPDTLWRNERGVFRDVTKEAFPPLASAPDDEWGVAAAWGDYDGDGWLDLFVVNYVKVDAIHPPPLHDHLGGVKVFPGPGMLLGEPDRLWRNRGDGTFEDVTGRAGVSRPDGRGMAVLAGDLDGDGRLDVSVMEDAMPNTLWRGRPGGVFQDVAHEAGVAVNNLGSPEGSMGVQAADLDRDGRLDLVYTNFRQEGTRACRSIDGTSYQDVSNSSRIAPLSMQYVGWGLILGDFDHDGWVDLFQVNGHFYPNVQDSPYRQPVLFLRNDGRAVFEATTGRWGPSLDAVRAGRCVASGDLDGDGDLDLVVTTIDGPVSVLFNEGRSNSSSSSIRLAGKPPNLEAIGARLEITAGGRTWADFVRRSGGFLGASDASVHVGLGTAEEIEAVVHWPDGAVSRHAHLPANARILIRQGREGVESEPFQRDDRRLAAKEPRQP